MMTRCRKAYLTFSKICFFTVLCSLAITIISFHVFIRYGWSYEDVVIDNQCYWEQNWFTQWWNFECGKDIPFGNVISFVINFGYYAFLPVMEPKIFLAIPPMFLLPNVVGYILVLSYPVFIIFKKYYKGTPRNAENIYFCAVKWFFILYFLLVFVLQGAIYLHLIRWG